MTRRTGHSRLVYDKDQHAVVVVRTPSAWTPREREARLAIMAEYKRDEFFYNRCKGSEWIDEGDAYPLQHAIARLIERNERLKRVPGEMG